MNEILKNACMMFGLATLPACQSGGPGDAISMTLATPPLTLIASIGKTIQHCWYKHGTNNFSKYRLANESNSYSGRPRLLLVPKHNPRGLPALVIQAEKTGAKSTLQAYGPLLSSNLGKQISSDLKKWATGSTTCQS